MSNNFRTDQKLAFFSQKLHLFLEAGIPLLQALSLLSTSYAPAGNQTVIKLIENLHKGYPLSTCLAYSRFPPFYCLLIETAEYHGDLSKTLSLLHSFYEKRDKRKKQFVKVVSYPILVFLSSLCTLIVVLQLLLPQFQSLYQTFRVELPWSSRMLIFLWKEWQGNQWWFYGFGLISLSFILLLYKKKRQTFDQWRMAFPLYSVYLKTKLTQMVSLQTGLLLESGVPILEICQLFQAGQNVSYVSNAFQVIGRELMDGKSISNAFRSVSLFLPLLIEVLSISEQAGTIGNSLQLLAEQLEQELEQFVARTSSAIEVILMVGMGGFILLVMFSLFVPLFGLMKQI